MSVDAAPVRLQGASISTGSTSSPTVVKAFASAVRDGSRLIAFINWGASTGKVTGVSDTVNGPELWRPCPTTNAVESSGPQQGEWWEHPNSAAGIPTVTATFDASRAFAGICLHELAGADPQIVGYGTGRSFSSTTAATTADVTPLTDNCYIAGACTNDIDSTNHPTATAPFTLREDPGTSTTQIVATEDETQSTATAVHAAFTWPTALTGTVHLLIVQPPQIAPPRRALALQHRG